MDRSTLRIIDANLNRSREGLRVCEDITRFILNSPALTRQLKSVRHSISDIGAKIVSSSQNLASSRDSVEDVGRRSKTSSEMGRSTVLDIFLANIERVKESLRVLEEFFKLFDRNASGRCSVLRFKVYGIEKKAVKRIETIR